MIGVLLAHLVNIEAKQGGQTLLSPVHYLGMAGVDLFFVVSGYVMVHVTWDTPRGQTAVLQFLAARFTRIFPLYWLVTLALLPVWLYRPDLVFGSLGGQPNLVTSLLLWPDQRPPLLAVGWTLVHEVLFYLVFAVSLLLTRRALAFFLLGWAGFVVAGNLAGLSGIGPVAGVLLSPLSLEFIAGAAAAWLVRRGYVRGGWLAIGMGAAGLALAFVFAVPYGDDFFSDHWRRVSWFCLPTALLIYGAVVLEFGGAQFPRWAVVIGDSSYSLYLTHLLTLTVLSMLWRPFSGPGLIDNLVALPLLVAGAIGVGLASWLAVERPLLRWRPSFRKQMAVPPAPHMP